MKKNTSVFLTVVSLFVFVIFTGCGKKGPLILDPPAQPGKIMELEIVQEGDDLRFSWKFPEYLDEEKTPIALSDVKKILIHMSDRPHTIQPENGGLEADQKKPESGPESSSGTRKPMGRRKKGSGNKSSSLFFLKKSRILKKIDISAIQKEKGTFQYVIPGISSKFLNKKIYLALNYRYNRLTSSLSEVKEIRIMHPLSPVTDLSGKAENKVIKLKWSYKIAKPKGKKPPQISGFNVFKKIESDGIDSKFKKINKDTVLKEYFEDTDTGISGRYHYYVVALITNTNISEKSNTVSMDIKDIFPPEIPGNLHIFKSKDGFMLSWKKVNDKDLSHYKVYRKDEKTDNFTLLAPKVTDNRYLDNTVKKGSEYTYVITSVDNNGNESDNSVEGADRF